MKLRYAEAIDYRDYEPKIKKLLDTHIQASEVLQLNEPVNIFDSSMFAQVKEERGIYGKTTAAQADAIAYATRKVITEKMDEDPAFYEKFSQLIQQAIEDFRAKRLSDLDYLNRVMEYRTVVATRCHDNMPEKLSGNEDAMAYFGVLKPFFAEYLLAPETWDAIAANTALNIASILERHWKVEFWDDEDAKNRVIDDIDDYLYDEVKGKMGLVMSEEQMNALTEKALHVAKSRSGR